jgi:transcriptional regulator with XRE-family HTH domain
MKHVGETLRSYIEDKHLVKGEIAKAAGISYNYLSTIFNKSSIDASLLEKLCKASGLSIYSVFDESIGAPGSISEVSANTVVGNASVQITSENAMLRELLAEKERTIQILLNNQNRQQQNN